MRFGWRDKGQLDSGCVARTLCKKRDCCFRAGPHRGDDVRNRGGRGASLRPREAIDFLPGSGRQPSISRQPNSPRNNRATVATVEVLTDQQRRLPPLNTPCWARSAGARHDPRVPDAHWRSGKARSQSNSGVRRARHALYVLTNWLTPEDGAPPAVYRNRLVGGLGPPSNILSRTQPRSVCDYRLVPCLAAEVLCGGAMVLKRAFWSSLSEA